MSTDENNSPLRGIAQNPAAFVAYLADVQRALLEIGTDLDTLLIEARLHLRNTHVEGDRWYHARLRARPVERQLQDVLRHLRGVTAGLEKAAYRRRAHDDVVNALPAQRLAKALAKEQKKRPILATGQAPTGRDSKAPDSEYDGPASIYDLDKRRSA